MKHAVIDKISSFHEMALSHAKIVLDFKVWLEIDKPTDSTLYIFIARTCEESFNAVVEP